QAPQQPVDVFPPEDALERIDRHVEVAMTEFGRFTVACERLFPLRIVQRRQRTHDRLPLDDRKPRMREPRDATYDHHREHERATRQQPDRYCEPRPFQSGYTKIHEETRRTRRRCGSLSGMPNRLRYRPDLFSLFVPLRASSWIFV